MEITTITQISPMDVTITTTKNGSPGPQGVAGVAAGVNPATPSTIPLRDASGRMKAADPSASDDVATKGYTDSLRRTGLAPYPLTYASSITPNASLGSTFRVTLTGALTLNGPTSPVDGQMISVEFTQDGTGSRLLTLPTTAGNWLFGTDVAVPVLSTVAGKTDIMTAVYRSAWGKWGVIGFVRGY